MNSVDIISVVIPVRNGMDTLERCLQSIRSQTISATVEIIILDSMSEDGSRDLAVKYQCKLIDILPGHFNHGLTRNIGVNNASGSLIYFTVQDAIIASPDFLGRMSGHFADASVVAVVGHQAVPHDKDKNPMQWYRPVSAPSVSVKYLPSPTDYNGLTIPEKQNLISWDNVVAMYRKDKLLDLPFVKTGFAEDWIWSFQALQKGGKLLHDSSLIVYHYHFQDYDYAFKSTYTLNYHLYLHFGFIPERPAFIKQFARILFHVIKNKDLSGKEKFFWIRHNLRYRMAVKNSINDFLKRLSGGGIESITQGYQKYCALIPQGKQNKINLS